MSQQNTPVSQVFPLGGQNPPGQQAARGSNDGLPAAQSQTQASDTPQQSAPASGVEPASGEPTSAAQERPDELFRLDERPLFLPRQPLPDAALLARVTERRSIAYERDGHTLGDYDKESDILSLERQIEAINKLRGPGNEVGEEERNAMEEKLAKLSHNQWYNEVLHQARLEGKGVVTLNDFKKLIAELDQAPFRTLQVVQGYPSVGHVDQLNKTIKDKDTEIDRLKKMVETVKKDCETDKRSSRNQLEELRRRTKTGVEESKVSERNSEESHNISQMSATNAESSRRIAELEQRFLSAQNDIKAKDQAIEDMQLKYSEKLMNANAEYNKLEEKLKQEAQKAQEKAEDAQEKAEEAQEKAETAQKHKENCVKEKRELQKEKRALEQEKRETNQKRAIMEAKIEVLSSNKPQKKQLGDMVEEKMKLELEHKDLQDKNSSLEEENEDLQGKKQRTETVLGETVQKLEAQTEETKQLQKTLNNLLEAHTELQREHMRLEMDQMGQSEVETEQSDDSTGQSEEEEREEFPDLTSELNKLRKDHDELLSNYNDLKAKHDKTAHTNKSPDIDAKIIDLEAEIKEKNNKITDLEEQVEITEEFLAQMKADHETQIEKTKAAKDTEINELNDKCERLNEALIQAQQKLSEPQQPCEGCANLTKELAETDAGRQELKELKEAILEKAWETDPWPQPVPEVHRTKWIRDIRGLKYEHLQYKKQIEDDGKEKTTLGTQLEACQKDGRELRNKISRLETRNKSLVSDLRNDIKRLEIDNEIINKHLTEAKEETKKVKATLAECRGKREELSEALQKAEQQAREANTSPESHKTKSEEDEETISNLETQLKECRTHREELRTKISQLEEENRLLASKPENTSDGLDPNSYLFKMLQEANNEADEANKSLDECEMKYELLAEDKEKLSKDLQEAQHEARGAEAKSEQYQKKINDLETQLEECRNHGQSGDQRIKSLDQQVEDLEREIEELQGKHQEDLRKRADQYLSKAETDRAAAERQIETLAKDLEKAKTELEVERTEAKGKLVQLRSDLAGVRAAAEQKAQEDVSRIEASLEEEQAERDVLQQQLTAAKEELETAQKQLITEKGSRQFFIKDLEEELAKRTQSQEELRGRLQECEEHRKESHRPATAVRPVPVPEESPADDAGETEQLKNRVEELEKRLQKAREEYQELQSVHQDRINQLTAAQGKPSDGTERKSFFGRFFGSKTANKDFEMEHMIQMEQMELLQGTVIQLAKAAVQSKQIRADLRSFLKKILEGLDGRHQPERSPAPSPKNPGTPRSDVDDGRIPTNSPASQKTMPPSSTTLPLPPGTDESTPTEPTSETNNQSRTEPEHIPDDQPRPATPVAPTSDTVNPAIASNPQTTAHHGGGGGGGGGDPDDDGDDDDGNNGDNNNNNNGNGSCNGRSGDNDNKNKPPRTQGRRTTVYDPKTRTPARRRWTRRLWCSFAVALGLLLYHSINGWRASQVLRAGYGYYYHGGMKGAPFEMCFGFWQFVFVALLASLAGALFVFAIRGMAMFDEFVSELATALIATLQARRRVIRQG